jgi:hypothetical protein
MTRPACSFPPLPARRAPRGEGRGVVSVVARVVVVTVVGVAMATSASCAKRTYTYYLIEPEPPVQATLEQGEALQHPFTYGTTTTMRVRWNDGDVLTEVDIPMLSSGQRVVIEHSGAVRDVPIVPAARIVPPPPTPADKSLIEAYRERGLRVEEGAPDVSVVTARERAQEAIKAGNYALALEWAELVLARYPSHPEFLRMKASVLLLIGEKAKAIQVYEKAEEIESIPSVRKKLDELEKED